MKVISGRLDRAFEMHQKEYEERAIEVLRSGWYVLGKQVQSFEEEFAEHNGADYCVGLASGLDALNLAVRALGIGPGDEVIVQANTYIATVMGITMNGATPIFVEPDEYFNLDATQIEKRISPKTRAIMVVHLYGQASNMDEIMSVARKHDLYVIEDCAQSHDACFNGRKTGVIGDIGCFSFYPTKNLGGFGDGGAILTNRGDIAERIKCLRNYGSRKKYHFDEVGLNSRLDELQAGLLRVRLNHLDEMTAEKKAIAAMYETGISNPKIVKPKVRPGATSVWHQYVVMCESRDELHDYLEQHDILTTIHYPIPPHLSVAYRNLGYKEGDFPVTEKMAREVLSLPIYNGMRMEEIECVIDVINQF